MAYVALYRKWRPASFDEVRGQDAVVTTLRNQILTDRVGHAYLFCGSRGTGKTSVAKIFARAVNCEAPVNGDACGNCAMCRAIAAGSSVNVIEIDAASNNGVDNIREIRDEVQYRPAEGRYRVYIIDEVHMLSPGAFNALLKTLEEPPSYVIFILATTEPHKIPLTVLSRCQRYDFRRLSSEDIIGRLRELAEGEQVAAEDRALAYIARKADGAMRDAISLFDQCISADDSRRLTYEDALQRLGTVDSEILSRMLRALIAEDTTEALAVTETVRLMGRDLSRFVQDLIWYQRNLLLLMTSGASPDVLEISGEDWLRLREESLRTAPAQLMRFIRLFSSLFNEMRTAADKRVLLEVAVIRATRPATEAGTEALEARLERLEKRTEQLEKRPAGAPAPQAGTAKQPDQAPVRVVTRAQWEDLQTVRKDWKRLLAPMDRITANALSDVWLEPKDGGVMGLVFPRQFEFTMAKHFGAVEAIREAVKNAYGRDIQFDCRLALDREEQPKFVTDDELSAIHMEIETEE